MTLIIIHAAIHEWYPYFWAEHDGDASVQAGASEYPYESALKLLRAALKNIIPEFGYTTTSLPLSLEQCGISESKNGAEAGLISLVTTQERGNEKMNECGS